MFSLENISMGHPSNVHQSILEKCLKIIKFHGKSYNILCPSIKSYTACKFMLELQDIFCRTSFVLSSAQKNYIHEVII
jgi:hypothetical protein